MLQDLFDSKLLFIFLFGEILFLQLHISLIEHSLQKYPIKHLMSCFSLILQYILIIESFVVYVMHLFYHDIELNLILEPNLFLFIGYPFRQKGYKLLDLFSHNVFVSWDVVFYESIFPYTDGLINPNFEGIFLHHLLPMYHLLYFLMINRFFLIPYIVDDECQILYIWTP
jgi:hypothetical protein